MRFCGMSTISPRRPCRRWGVVSGGISPIFPAISSSVLHIYFLFRRSTLLSLRPSNHQPSPSIATTSHSTPPPQTPLPLTPSLPPPSPPPHKNHPTTKPPPHPTSSQKPSTPTHTPHAHSKPTTDASLNGNKQFFF